MGCIQEPVDAPVVLDEAVVVDEAPVAPIREPVPVGVPEHDEPEQPRHQWPEAEEPTPEQPPADEPKPTEPDEPVDAPEPPGSDHDPDEPDPESPPELVCEPATKGCSGLSLATCSTMGDGWVLSPCPPGHHCALNEADAGVCVPVADHLTIVFDTSGSMDTKVPGLDCESWTWPQCESSAQPCTRIGVSKDVFSTVLADIDPLRTSLSLFKFPQVIEPDDTPSCTSGHYGGKTTITGDPDTHTISEASSWFWANIHQSLGVAFPETAELAGASKTEILKWMDGSESLAETCVSGQPYCHADPELRATGSTPIGRTLFYVGEYMRHRVMIGGRSCETDDDCPSANYRCDADQGVCTDPARHCRRNTVVVFTDGKGASFDEYFTGPVQAKRMAYGLGCAADADCVGGATCSSAGICTPADATGYVCQSSGEPCDPASQDPNDPLWCPMMINQQQTCLPDPVSQLETVADLSDANILRSPDGQPFGARVFVVDISGQDELADSFKLAAAGGGALITADITDQDKLLEQLQGLLDVKNSSICVD